MSDYNIDYDTTDTYEPPSGLEPPLELYEEGGSTPHLQFYVLDRHELQLTGDVDEMQDQCGNNEIRRSGDHGWTLVVEGVIPEAKRIDLIRAASGGVYLAKSDEVEGLYDSTTSTMPCFIRDFNITRVQKENGIEFPNHDAPQKVYHFQMQLKSTSN